MPALSRNAVRQLWGGLLFGGLFLLVFWPTFVWMAQRFDAADSFYSHGWLIPFAVGWLIWQRRHRVPAQRRYASAWGLALLIPSLVVHTLATWWRLHFVSGFAMLGVVWGLVWTLWGGQTVWQLRFPLLFLLFMVPLPGILLIFISFKMKLFAAMLATHVVGWIGIPAEQAGSTIHIPGMSVIVDDTCSGLRSLISLIALSILWTSVMGPGSRWWHRLTMVAASIPVALAANMVRIVVLILLSAIYGPQIAEGFLHYGSGVVVFGVALAILAWLGNSLVRNPVPVS